MSMSFYVASGLYEELIGALQLVYLEGITVENGGLVTVDDPENAVERITDATKNAYNDGVDETTIDTINKLRAEIAERIVFVVPSVISVGNDEE